MFDLNKIVRENIKKLTPYSSARDEFKGNAEIFLDANENSIGSPLEKNFNRYPDPLQMKLKEKISTVKGMPVQNIFLGNGSDEAIDILYRTFCKPGKDNVILVPPTYGMYEVSANINDVVVRKVLLNAEFQLNIEGISDAVDENTKLIFLCSPNNPTGNSLDRDDIEFVLNNFSGIVVIDEAYVNFSGQKSLITELNKYPNLVILQTLSKAWGMAGLRIGMAFASAEIISLFNKIKLPYNINDASQQMAIEALESIELVNCRIREIVSGKEKLIAEIQVLSFVKKIFPSDANFILVKVNDVKKVYSYLCAKGIIVRDRSQVELCEGCLRITVGTNQENKVLIEKLKQYT